MVLIYTIFNQSFNTFQSVPLKYIHEYTVFTFLNVMVFKINLLLCEFEKKQCTKGTLLLPCSKINLNYCRIKNGFGFSNRFLVWCYIPVVTIIISYLLRICCNISFHRRSAYITIVEIHLN